ncbi:MAG TPA: hypothetical protein VFV92_14995 [Candidatus Bathyarchaeia archaeon]|nr:hypothetical protein [Candidatus Bathyarchaeia archaeon]
MTPISCPAVTPNALFLLGGITMIWKKILATIIVLAIVAGGVYLLFAAGGGNMRGGEGDGGALAAPNARMIVTLTVWGGSAFITGFGLRDMIGRAAATRQRNRLKTLAQQQVRH